MNPRLQRRNGGPIVRTCGITPRFALPGLEQRDVLDQPIDLPPLKRNLEFGFEFADPIFRLGNDYSKGIILSTGYVGQKTPNDLVTCLTDGHPGVSGGGVLNREGELVGIPVGRMQGDFRFSFILPLRHEMFRKIDFLND